MYRSLILALLFFISREIADAQIVSNKLDDLPVLKIQRDENLEENFAGNFLIERELGDELVERRYIITPTIVGPDREVDTVDGGTDPFAGENSSRIVRHAPKTARQILEDAGIVFAIEGSSATFDARKGFLTVVNSCEEMEKVEDYVESIAGGMERQIVVRSELFEVSQMIGLEVIESLNSQVDHRMQS